MHKSVASNRSDEDRALPLHRCFDAFAAEESIAEAYCSKCKQQQNASLKTEFWRLPPVLVVRSLLLL